MPQRKLLWFCLGRSHKGAQSAINDTEEKGNGGIVVVIKNADDWSNHLAVGILDMDMQITEKHSDEKKSKDRYVWVKKKNEKKAGLTRKVLIHYS